MGWREEDGKSLDRARAPSFTERDILRQLGGAGEHGRRCEEGGRDGIETRRKGGPSQARYRVTHQTVKPPALQVLSTCMAGKLPTEVAHKLPKRTEGFNVWMGHHVDARNGAHVM